MTSKNDAFWQQRLDKILALVRRHPPSLGNTRRSSWRSWRTKEDAKARPSYLDIIRDYAIPTGEQTRAFAEHVAGAHSWYKHLPLYPPVSFYFYLDPNAGRSAVRSEKGEMRFEDIVDESSRFHYTWQLTATYRERFGYWNYFAPYGTHFQIPSGTDTIDTRESGHVEAGPAILAPRTGWIRVPDMLLQAGKAEVTALVDKERNFSLYWASEEEGGRRVDWITFLERRADALPSNARTAMVNWLTFWNDPTYEELRETDNDTAFKRLWDFEKQEVFPLLDRERERQLAGMEAAMNRFLGSI